MRPKAVSADRRGRRSIDTLAQVPNAGSSEISHLSPQNITFYLQHHHRLPIQSSPCVFSISALYISAHNMFSARQIFSQVQRRGFAASARQVCSEMMPLRLLDRRLLRWRVNWGRFADEWIVVVQGDGFGCRWWHWPAAVAVVEAQPEGQPARPLRYPPSTR